jgi:nucleotide-binding universal stress UspA family protein
MIEKVLVGTDTSASADVAVQAAADLARVRDAELLVLYVRGPVQSADAADPKKAAIPRGTSRR